MKKMVLFAAVASMMLVGCKKQDAAIVTEEEQAAEPVEVTVLQSREIQREISLSSNLQGYETVNIAPSLTGKIEHIYTEVGTRVRKGDSLVRMDQQQYNTTKLVYSNLLVEMKRVEGLIQTGSVSQQTYDQTKLQLDQTKENLDFLTKNTFVRAPFSGVISAKNYEDGELYSGQPILVLTQIDRLKAGSAARRCTADGCRGHIGDIAHRLHGFAVIDEIRLPVEQPQLSAHQERGGFALIHVIVQLCIRAGSIQPPQVFSFMTQRIGFKPVQSKNFAVKLGDFAVARSLDRKKSVECDHDAGIGGTCPVHLGLVGCKIYTCKPFDHDLLYGIRCGKLVWRAHSSASCKSVSVHGA